MNPVEKIIRETGEWVPIVVSALSLRKRNRLDFCKKIWTCFVKTFVFDGTREGRDKEKIGLRVLILWMRFWLYIPYYCLWRVEYYFSPKTEMSLTRAISLYWIRYSAVVRTSVTCVIEIRHYSSQSCGEILKMYYL